MNRLSDNDRNWGPFTLAPWKNWLEVRLGSDEGRDPFTYLMLVGFGWALRTRLPNFLNRGNPRYRADEVEYGVQLTKQGDNGYDFLSIHYGLQTYDSSTSKSWSKSLPWKMWNHVRHTIYEPNGALFAELAHLKWDQSYELRNECPRAHFGFEDYDGEMIVASCRIEEREWHRGEKWFRWLRFFYKPLVRRSLDLEFSAEVGPQKGSWKGGTLGHGIEMQPGETPEQAFRRYCKMDHERKGTGFRLKFIGPCQPPKPKTPVA